MQESQTLRPGVRQLSPVDLSTVLKLDSKHKKHMNIDKTSGRFDSVFWQRFLTNDSERHTLLGYEENGILLATMGMVKWPSFPYWTISGFQTTPGRHAYSYATNPAMPALWHSALNLAEADGRYKFYMIKSNKWRSRRHMQQWYDYVGTERGYVISIETEIQPNTIPPFKGYWGLMGEQTWPEHLHVLCGTKANVNIFD